jgi:hypothetical protein
MTHIVFERGRVKFYGPIADLIRKKYLYSVQAKLKYRNNISSKVMRRQQDFLTSQLTDWSYRLEIHQTKICQTRNDTPCMRTPHLEMTAPVCIVVLETDPIVKKCVIKRYPNGRTLTLLVVDEKNLKRVSRTAGPGTTRGSGKRKRKGRILGLSTGKRED